VRGHTDADGPAGGRAQLHNIFSKCSLWDIINQHLLKILCNYGRNTLIVGSRRRPHYFLPSSIAQKPLNEARRVRPEDANTKAVEYNIYNENSGRMS